MLRVRFLRCSKGIRQADVTEATNINRLYYQLIEAGRLTPTAEQAKALADYFKVANPAQLFEHIDDPVTSQLLVTD